jgi:tetratricopeptide (TPR) repeat protein
MGRMAESAHAYSRAVKVREKAQGPDHLDVANTLYALAGVQAATSNANAALDTFHRALEIREKQLGKEHQLVALTLHSIAQVLARHGRKKEAIDAFNRALAIKVASLGPEHPETAVTRFELGRALRDAGDPSGVAQMMGAASLLERVLGKDHPNVKAARKLLVQ